MKRKAQRIRNEMLVEARCPLATTGKQTDPWPILKEKLDKAFSELVRMTYADELGNVKCITCSSSGPWRDFDNGHFVDRDHLPTRWDMDNCRPQCQTCNRFKTGRRYEFGRALNLELVGTADRLIELSSSSGDPIRQKATEMLLEIREKLKIQRKRFK